MDIRVGAYHECGYGQAHEDESGRTGKKPECTSMVRTGRHGSARARPCRFRVTAAPRGATFVPMPAVGGLPVLADVAVARVP